MKKYIRKQQVLEALAEGCEIYTGRNEHKGTKGQTVYRSLCYYLEDKNTKIIGWVHSSTIQSLQKNGLINNKYERVSPKTPEQ